MNTPHTLPTLSLKRPLAWAFYLSVLFSSVAAASILDMPIVFSLAITLAIISITLLRTPLALLGMLTIVRMSIDHLSENLSITSDGNGIDPHLSLSQILGVFLLFISIVIFILYWEKLSRFVLWKPFLLLVGMETILLPWSIAPLLGIQEIARIISLFSIAFLAYVSISSENSVKKIYFIILFSGVIPILESVRQAIFGIGMTDNIVESPRLYGTFAHPNVLALFLYSLCVVLTLLFFFTKNSTDTRQGSVETPQKLETFLWLFFSFTLLSSLLIFTYTRIAWVALFLFMLSIALWRYRILLFPLIIIPILLLVALPSVQDRFFGSFQTNPDSSIVWRQGIWSDVTAKLRIDGRQYFGTGPDTFSLYAEKLRGIQFGSTDAHNDFVKFFVEGGWFGLFLFIGYLTLLGKELRSLFTLPNPYRDIAVIFSIYAGTLLLASLSDNIYKDTPIQWIFFILFGSLLALKDIIAPPTQEENPQTL